MFQYAILTFNSNTHTSKHFWQTCPCATGMCLSPTCFMKMNLSGKDSSTTDLHYFVSSSRSVDKFGVFWSSEMYTWHFKASLMETLTSFTAPAIFTFRVKNSKGKKNLPLIVYVFTWRQKSTKFPRPNLMITWKWSEGSIKWKKLLRIILFQKVGRLISTMAIPKH